MPATHRNKPLYRRGEFSLYALPGRNHEIVRYDERRKRERSISAGTTDEREARIALDNEYVKKHGGVPHCPTCGQPRQQADEFATVLIANYKETKPVGDAVHPRLDHILLFMEVKARTDDRCGDVDAAWAQEFRTWMSRRIDRERAPGTIENSLIQLAAAFRFGGVTPAFTTIPTTQVNSTPQHRSSINEMAAMFRYAMEPKKKRDNLLRYLRAAVATWARPDAVHEINTSKARGQWHSAARVLNLNPVGRRQTRKRRATVVVARQFAPHLDQTEGAYIPIGSVRSAWDSMSEKLNLPRDGEAGMKLIRRSMMTLARRRLGEEHWKQGCMMAGHVPFNVSDLYALVDPANLGRALAVTEAIIDEIEALAPGAFTAHLPQAAPDVAASGAGKDSSPPAQPSQSLHELTNSDDREASRQRDWSQLLIQDFR